MIMWAIQIVLAVVFGAAGTMKAGALEGAACGQAAPQLGAGGT